MSSFFSASDADIETCFSKIIHNPRAVMCYLSFLAVFLVMVLSTDQLSPYNFLLWLALSAFLLVAFLKVFSCQQRLDAPTGSDEMGHEEQQVHVPPFATREQLPDIRIQLALLDREFDERDYDALRALDADVVPNAPAMSEEEINALPLHKHTAQSCRGSSYGINSDRSSEQHESSSTFFGNEILSEDALECGVCLEEVIEGELVRRLACSHQFHASCIHPWLQRRGTCPICKCKAQQDSGV